MLSSVGSEEGIVLTIPDFGKPGGSSLESQSPARIESVHPAVDCGMALERDLKACRRFKASLVEDTLVASKPSLISSCGTMIASIGLIPTQVKECLRVVT